MTEGQTAKSNTDAIIVLDIGCRWGFAEKFLQPECLGMFKIYGFDPDREECARLQQRYIELPDGMVTCVPKALSGKTGWRNLYLTKDPGCSSLYPPIQYLAAHYPALDCIQLEKVTLVHTTTLNAWAGENNITSIDYIKIDTQGSELEILKGGESLLETVRCIDIEVEFNPIYQGQCLFFEVDAYLRSMDFQLWRFSNLVHYSRSGKAMTAGENNIIHFDSKISHASPAHGGQLFWADARYVHADVLAGCASDVLREEKDQRLFTALNMADVIDHIQRSGGGR